MQLALIVLVWTVAVIGALVGLALFSWLTSQAKLLDAQAATERARTPEVTK